MMGEAAMAEFAIGESRHPGQGVPYTQRFDWFRTVISQYANSPILLQVIENIADYIEPAALTDAFFFNIWDVDTATGYGLDVWGRIVGVGRVLQIPSDTDYLGFAQSPDAYPFNEGVFYRGGGATSNFALSDFAYRRLILAKALANICDGSIPAINAILMALFSQYGNCYVRDNGDMTMEYVFGATLSPVDFAIVAQSGALPKTTGVSVTIVQP